MASTTSIQYYIDVTDKAMGENCTPDYAPQIAADCTNLKPAAFLPTVASVAVRSATGAPAVPVGFSPVGVVAGGAGQRLRGLGSTADHR